LTTFEAVVAVSCDGVNDVPAIHEAEIRLHSSRNLKTIT